MDFVIVAAFIICIFALAYGVGVLVLDEDSKQDCIAQYEICVDTNEGWMPYEAL